MSTARRHGIKTKVKVGFTGSRCELSAEQRIALMKIFMDDDIQMTEFHHGECVGADAEAHVLCRVMTDASVPIIGHPPSLETFHAKPLEVTERRPPRPYILRNKDIIKETNWLIACPAGRERVRSGTWSTVRYARKLKRQITIIMPDGEVREEN